MTPNELEVWKELNELEVVKTAFDPCQPGDRFCYEYHGKIHTYITAAEGGGMDGDHYWIPQLFDPIRPERSLIGLASQQGSVDVHYNDWMMKWVTHITPDDEYEQWTADRPDLALAKAIIERCKDER